MKVSKSVFVRQGANLRYGVVAVALSFFIFAYSTRFGQVSVLAYYGLWLPLVLIDYRAVLGRYSAYLWIFAFAVFAFLSIFWSAAPGVSGRASIQYLSHVVCALIAMRTIDIRTLTLGAVAGVGLVLAYSLAFGVYHFDALDGSYSFVGAFASKNQLGLYASLGLYFAFATLFIVRQRGPWLLVAGGVGLLSCYCLAASQSATSVLTTAVVLVLGLALQVVLMLSPHHRLMLFLGAAALTGLLLVAGIYLGLADAVLGLFGKDSTLTGRTYLWQQGIQAALQSPLFGTGYQAYWVQGFSEPERLWSEFFIGSRSGFHFHNTFIEAVVETGLIGLILLCLPLVVGLCGHLNRLIGDHYNPESYVLFGIAALLVVRAFVEIDILTPYHVGSFLMYFVAGKLTLPRATGATADPAGYAAAERATP